MNFDTSSQTAPQRDFFKLLYGPIIVLTLSIVHFLLSLSKNKWETSLFTFAILQWKEKSLSLHLLVIYSFLNWLFVCFPLFFLLLFKKTIIFFSILGGEYHFWLVHMMPCLNRSPSVFKRLKWRLWVDPEVVWAKATGQKMGHLCWRPFISPITTFF